MKSVRVANKKKQKKISWSPDIVDEKLKTRARFFNKPKQKNITFSRLQKLIIRRVDNEEWEALNRDLQTFNVGKKILEEFFADRGERLFGEALITLIKPNLLQFFLDNISKESIDKTLMSKNFKLLKRFFRAQSTLQELSWYTEEEKSQRIERLTLLLRRHGKKIKEFIHSHSDEPYMTPEIFEEFNQAIIATKQEVASDNKAADKIKKPSHEVVRLGML